MLTENCKVGMTVRCIESASYGVTNNKVACKILKIFEKDILVQVEYDIENHTDQDLDNGKYRVEAKYFEPYTIKKLFIEVEW